MIAVVTGASRGGGRGIALAVGELGATVYVTGRTRRGGRGPDDLSGTIDDTADEVTARGGVGIPVRTDHTVDAEIASLFERVRREQGRLDLLVNNAWGGYEEYDSDESFDAPFWEQPLSRLDKMLNAGVRATAVTSYFGVRLMLPHHRGLIVNTSLHTGIDDWDLDRKGPVAVFYEAAKTAINRLAFGMAHNLRPYGVAALALAPGWMRTEAVMRHDLSPESLARTESVEYVGRAIAALATDSNVMRWTGHVLRVGDLAREYGFTDVDGRRPVWP